MKKLTLPADVALSVDERRWLSIYRRMNDDARRTNLFALEYVADAFPRRIAPAFKLIVGGAA